MCLAYQPERLGAFVRASSLLTHRDALAEDGARVVALAAAHAARQAAADAAVDAAGLLRQLDEAVSSPELREALRAVGARLARGALRVAAAPGRLLPL